MLPFYTLGIASGFVRRLKQYFNFHAYYFLSIRQAFRIYLIRMNEVNAKIRRATHG